MDTCTADSIALENNVFALSARCTVYPLVLCNDQIVEDHNLYAGRM